MANNINNRFIHFSTYESFKKYKDNISGESIVFIKDLQLIYTHGTFYGEQSDLSDLEGISVITISGDDIISGSISKSDTTANITLSHSESGVTKGSYGNNASTTPSIGSSITIPKVTVDSKGHISSASNQTIQLPGTTLDDLGITATAAEINYVDGVTGSIQSQLNSKQPTITGAASTITTNNLTGSKVLISNSSGKVTASSVTSTELGYLSGVTGGIQSQLNTLDSSLDNILSNVATIKYVDDKVKSLFRYKGTVGTGGTVTSLPATHSTGDAYLVKVAGSYAGQNCEEGDLIICIISGTTANESDWSVINTNWSVEIPEDNSLVWESEKTIATIGGIPVKVTLPGGSVESTFTGKEVTSDTPSKTTSINSITSAGSVPTREKTTPASGTHTHSFTPAGTVFSEFKGTQGTTSKDTTNTATIYSITSVGSVPTVSEVKPSSGTHTHSLTAEGTVSSSFTGTPGNTGKAGTTNTVTINSLSGVGSLPSRSSVSVPKVDHTHSFTPEGTITSTFTGSSVIVPASASTTSVNSITSVGTLPSVTMPTTSVSYSSGILTITHNSGSYTAGTLPTYTTKTVSASNHTHSVTAEGSITSTFSGDSTNTDSTTDTTSVYSITGLGSVPSYTEITVPSSDHIHSYTPAGSVASSFTGDSVTSGTPSATISVNSITNVGSVPTRSAAITVSTSNHTHSLTPSGTIESSFTGTSDLNSGTPSATIDVYSITGLGSVPAYQSVSVASSDHTHDVTAEGIVDSEFLGTTSNSN